MASAARKVATYEDLLKVPSHLVAEIINGTLYTMSRPAPRHARSATRLSSELYGFDSGRGGPGGWVILFEPELHLGSHVLVPDIAGWKRDRMPELPDAAYFTLAPDWVCEVLSGSTEDIDRAEKMPIYGEHRVAHIWLVDPVLQTLEVFKLDGPTYRLLKTWRGAEKVRAEPFDAMELDLAVLWQK